MPEEQFDHILIGIGGNDVMRLSSPRQMAAGYDRIAEPFACEESGRGHIYYELPDDHRFADNATADKNDPVGIVEDAQ